MIAAAAIRYSSALASQRKKSQILRKTCRRCNVAVFCVSFESQVKIKEVQMQGELRLRASEHLASISSTQAIPLGIFTTISPIKFSDKSEN